MGLYAFIKECCRGVREYLLESKTADTKERDKYNDKLINIPGRGMLHASGNKKREIPKKIPIYTFARHILIFCLIFEWLDGIDKRRERG